MSFFFTFRETGLCQLIERIKVKKLLSPCKPTKKDQVFSPLPEVAGIQLKRLIKVKDFFHLLTNSWNPKGQLPILSAVKQGAKRNLKLIPKRLQKCHQKWALPGLPKVQNTMNFLVFCTKRGPEGVPFFYSKMIPEMSWNWIQTARKSRICTAGRAERARKIN